MSSDSLVLKIFEKDENNIEINRLYVFYDHNLRTFGLRGGYDTRKMGVDMTHYYSYYTDTEEGVIAMIDMLSNHYVKLSLCLVKYTYLPNDSDDISYGLLKHMDKMMNEIVGFDYYSSQKTKTDITRFLYVLKNVYNDY
jgi:hypothetical protein